MCYFIFCLKQNTNWSPPESKRTQTISYHAPLLFNISKPQYERRFQSTRTSIALCPHDPPKNVLTTCLSSNQYNTLLFSTTELLFPRLQPDRLWKASKFELYSFVARFYFRLEQILGLCEIFFQLIPDEIMASESWTRGVALSVSRLRASFFFLFEFVTALHRFFRCFSSCPKHWRSEKAPLTFKTEFW